MIEKLIRKDLLGLTAYPTAEKSLPCRLHANESPWDWLKEYPGEIAALLETTAFNHYPDGSGQALRAALGEMAGVSEASVVLGSGSDELIKMVAELFLEPGDAAVIHTPTFSEYGVAVRICSGVLHEVASGENFEIDLEAIIGTANATQAKLVFLCTPNNPTGTVLTREQVLEVVDRTTAVVVCDEAYYEFSGITVADEAARRDRLLVLRTLSKAYGLAGLRIGYAICTETVAAYLNSVRMPYNINSLTQGLALLAIEKKDRAQGLVRQIREAREALFRAARGIAGLQVYNGGANFLLYRTEKCVTVAEKLAALGIMTRLFSNPRLAKCIRINLGTAEANQAVLTVLQEVDHAAG